MSSFVSKSKRSKNRNKPRLPSLKLSFDLDSSIPGVPSISSQHGRDNLSHLGSNLEFGTIYEAPRHQKFSSQLSEKSLSFSKNTKFKVRSHALSHRET